MNYETFTEFAQRQNCEHERLTQYIYFENGALSDGAFMHMEPPTDPNDFVRIRRQFLKAKIHRLNERYKAEKKAVGTQAEWHATGSAPPPDEYAMRDLQALADQITPLQKELDSLTEQTIVVQGRNAYDERRAAERKTARQTIGALASLPNFRDPFPQPAD